MNALQDDFVRELAKELAALDDRELQEVATELEVADSRHIRPCWVFACGCVIDLSLACRLALADECERRERPT